MRKYLTSDSINKFHQYTIHIGINNFIIKQIHPNYMQQLAAEMGKVNISCSLTLELFLTKFLNGIW